MAKFLARTLWGLENGATVRPNVLRQEENAPMDTKVFEIRDRCTYVPVIAIKMSPGSGTDEGRERRRYMLRHCGYDFDHPSIMLIRMDGGKCSHDPYHWGDRTMHTAHLFIAEHFADLKEGQVVDV